MYITAAEYLSLTGRPASEASTYRLTIASKLLDARIGNYIIQDDGYKIDSSTWKVWWNGILTEISQAKKDAVKLWVSQMVSYLTDNNDSPPSNDQNVKLGRFSVGNNSNLNSIKLIPDSMNFVDSILVSSGIINRAVNMSRYKHGGEYEK